MSIEFDEKKVIFQSIVYEDQVKDLREYLQKNEPESINFDFTGCDDVHLSILQVVLAYKKTYECTFDLGSSDLMYVKVIEGFDTSEMHCS